MHLSLAHIGARASQKDPLDSLVAMYLARCEPFVSTRPESFREPRALWDWIERQRQRTPAVTVLLDGCGRQMSSEAFAAWLGARRDAGTQHVVFAIGPASGWCPADRERAQLVLSLGSFALPHALARLVMAEQVYRAVTILTGHPYHTGH